jgi:hypothetical protein
MSATDRFVCPITLEPVVGPVAITAAGHAYDPDAIQCWFAAGNETDPVTGMKLTSAEVTLFPFNDDANVLNEHLEAVRREFLRTTPPVHTHVSSETHATAAASVPVRPVPDFHFSRLDGISLIVDVPPLNVFRDFTGDSDGDDIAISPFDSAGDNIAISPFAAAGIVPVSPLTPVMYATLRETLERHDGTVPHAVLIYVQRNTRMIDWALTKRDLAVSALVDLQARYATELRLRGRRKFDIFRRSGTRLCVHLAGGGHVMTTVPQLAFVQWMASQNALQAIETYASLIKRHAERSCRDMQRARAMCCQQAYSHEPCEADESEGDDDRDYDDRRWRR